MNSDLPLRTRFSCWNYLMVDIRGNAAKIVMEIKTGMRMLISKSDNKIVLQPVPSFTDELAGVTAGSFGQSAEEVQERLDRGFAPFSELKSTSARP